MTGFRPAWLSAVAEGWFNDSEGFFMIDYQSGRGNYSNEDALIHAHFRLKLAGLDSSTITSRAQNEIFYPCCNELPGNTEDWLQNYNDNNSSDTGKFIRKLGRLRFANIAPTSFSQPFDDLVSACIRM